MTRYVYEGDVLGYFYIILFQNFFPKKKKKHIGRDRKIFQFLGWDDYGTDNSVGCNHLVILKVH